MKTDQPAAGSNDPISDERYYAVLELLSYAQHTGHPLEDETTAPAVAHVCALADKGDNEARFLAARYYLVNSEDDSELDRAAAWLMAAAEAGHEEALALVRELM